jgi:hypothetical protein
MRIWLTFFLLLLIQSSARAELEYPGPEPDEMQISVDGKNVLAGNNTISAGWILSEHGLSRRFVRDEQTRQSISLNGECFQVILSDGTRYAASTMRPGGKTVVSRLVPDPRSSRLAGRIGGMKVEIPLRSQDGRIQVMWRAIGHDGSNYLREEIELSSTETDLAIREIIWFDQAVPGVRTYGRVDGSPVVAGNFFIGYEDPMATNRVPSQDAAPGVLCSLNRNATLGKGQQLTQSFVVGVAPAGQMRRAFLVYLERERAHPYRPFLHYNAWFDICWGGVPLDEAKCLGAVRGFGENLIKAYDVIMDSMVIDDGWDDPASLWQFNRGFPEGFAAFRELCQSYSTRVGVWLSPFGGYGKAKEQRLKYGRQQGFEINAAGFSLAGPKYYERFRDECLNMIRRYGVNYFKFDGIASGMYANGSGAEYILDTEAMRQLMLELRKEAPDLFINLTTGSWPSPFWLRYADSLWRQGEDTAYSGKGSSEQRWLNYRDKEVYQNIVGKGPLYPLNSLMTCGICYSRYGNPGNPEFNSAGLKQDIRDFFASGTHLQELYLMPGRLKPEDWKVLAETAKWSRANADVLVDTHWIGGDPNKDQVYGWASWTPQKGIITLRNPDDRTRRFLLDVQTAFELPAGAPTRYTLKSPWIEDSHKPPVRAARNVPLILSLQPFEIVTYEATPVP